MLQLKVECSCEKRKKSDLQIKKIFNCTDERIKQKIKTNIASVCISLHSFYLFIMRIGCRL